MLQEKLLYFFEHSRATIYQKMPSHLSHPSSLSRILEIDCGHWIVQEQPGKVSEYVDDLQLYVENINVLHLSAHILQ